MVAAKKEHIIYEKFITNEWIDSNHTQNGVWGTKSDSNLMVGKRNRFGVALGFQQVKKFYPCKKQQFNIFNS
jgi:hypothetical protein